MRPFAYTRPADARSAIAAAAEPEAKFLGGGTNLVDLMKMGVERPARLVDITRLPLDRVEEHGGGLRIGAMARNAVVASHPLVRSHYPVLSDAILAGASPQVRNMATTAGNLMQRTRCFYFYDPSYPECNKRTPGSGCAALEGYNRIHAILGASEQCIATYPGDMAVALAALDARIIIQGPGGERAATMDAFYRLPGSTPHLEHELKPNELITAVELPAMRASGSHYVKVRDRNSFAFALVSVAAVVDLDEGRQIREARVAVGSVAPRPWRVPQAEDALRGKAPGEAVFRQAAEILLQGAATRRHNGYKVELAKRAIVRALTAATSPA